MSPDTGPARESYDVTGTFGGGRFWWAGRLFCDSLPGGCLAALVGACWREHRRRSAQVRKVGGRTVPHLRHTRSVLQRPPSGTIPDAPGSYQFRDRDGRVIYVGKAKSLRSRLSNYFQNPAHLPPRTAQMVGHAETVEWIQVRNDVEALMLEYSLIKQHKPRFNVRLRDDKSYPFLALTVSDEWPRALVRRGTRDKGSRYFGPYAHAYAIRETLDSLTRTFPIRTCSDIKFRNHQRLGRPCLLYHIEKCSGPCIGAVGHEEYEKLVEELVSFLDGDTQPVIRRLEAEMREAADHLEFEKAGRLRDRLAAVRKAVEKQQMVTERAEDLDCFGLVEDELEAAIQVFYVRRGRVVGRKGFIVDKVEDLTRGELVAQVIEQHYDDPPLGVPPLVLVPEVPDEVRTVEEWLAVQRSGSAVAVLPRPAVPDEVEPEGGPEPVRAGAGGEPVGAGAGGEPVGAGAAGEPAVGEIPAGEIPVGDTPEAVAAGGEVPGGDRPEAEPAGAAMVGPASVVDHSGAAGEWSAGPDRSPVAVAVAEEPGPQPRNGEAFPAVDDGAPTADSGRAAAGTHSRSAVGEVEWWAASQRYRVERSVNPEARAGVRVEIRVPQRGDKKALLEMVTKNAGEEFVRHRLKRAADHNARAKALNALQEALDLPESPLRIECYDMSHLQGTDYVGSMVVMEDGLPRPQEYRRFKVRTVEGNDDFASMGEVLTRRLTAYLVERNKPVDERRRRFAYPPQLILVDGGKGQLNVATRVLEELGLEEEIPVAALAKQFEEVYLPGRADPLRIPRTSEALYLLQQIRDEAHRFAITYHRNLRGKRMTASILDGIPGLGPKRKKRLVRELGGMKAVKVASKESLEQLPWLPDTVAAAVYERIHG
jgi:excinuclease UvrABC nuclease subunit